MLLPLRDLAINYVQSGSGAPVILAHPEGLSLAAWDAVAALLSDRWRIVRADMRGHGGTGCPAPPYAMGALIRDAEALMDALHLRDAVFVGLGAGGLVAQGLAVKRLDLVRGLVLINTAARIPAPAAWQEAQETATEMGPLIEPLIDRWFPRAMRESEPADTARTLLRAADASGYAGVSAAMSGTDFYTTTATLTLPTLVVASAGDAATPPDLVRETAELILGAEFRVLRGAGHLPCLDQPQELATLIAAFLTRIGH